MDRLEECVECGVEPYVVTHDEKLAIRCDCEYLAVGGPAYLRNFPDSWSDSDE